jgi:hypothetical protein
MVGKMTLGHTHLSDVWFIQTLDYYCPLLRIICGLYYQVSRGISRQAVASLLNNNSNAKCRNIKIKYYTVKINNLKYIVVCGVYKIYCCHA